MNEIPQGNDDGSMDNKYNKGFGKNQQANTKESMKKKQQEKDAMMKQKLDDLKKNVAPGKSEAEKEEQKILKVFKDKQLNINPEDFEEVDPVREPCSMVFIGHVDAGKSTICGNLMFMMGVVD